MLRSLQMNLESILKYIRSLSDPALLLLISKVASSQYHQIATRRKGMHANLAPGDSVSFILRDGTRVRGVVERRGKINYRITAEDGTLYRVPSQLLQKERERVDVETRPAPVSIEQLVPVVLQESERLLYASGVVLPVRYKHGVWATHFRPDRHIQYGEKCLRYQMVSVKTSDNVSANLRRYRIREDVSARIAMLICHEVAHAIAHHRYGRHIAPHGRQFYAVLSELVETEFADVHDNIQQHIAAHRMSHRHA